MLNSFPIALLVGTVLGFLAGLGVGGGSLLILWLTLIQNVDPRVARTVNLLFFLPTALIASVFRWKQGSLTFQKIAPAIVAGCATAIAFASISQKIAPDILKKSFGVLLLIIGLRELLYRPKN